MKTLHTFLTSLILISLSISMVKAATPSSPMDVGVLAATKLYLDTKAAGKPARLIVVDGIYNLGAVIMPKDEILRIYGPYGDSKLKKAKLEDFPQNPMIVRMTLPSRDEVDAARRQSISMAQMEAQTSGHGTVVNGVSLDRKLSDLSGKKDSFWASKTPNAVASYNALKPYVEQVNDSLFGTTQFPLPPRFAIADFNAIKTYFQGKASVRDGTKDGLKLINIEFEGIKIVVREDGLILVKALDSAAKETN